MNPLARICSVDDILLDINAIGQQQLFDTIARHVHDNYGLADQHIARRLAEREKMGTTALGKGVAIPHARVPGLQVAIGLIIRPTLPLPFGAADGKPVEHFLTLLVPEHATQTHLDLLAAAAGLLWQNAFRDALKQAHSPREVHRLLLGVH
ncbi:PTS sugar transporter subunit IIA [Parachitinimonas caeni]|uniref:PTS sugar transporter subunit IIA n=1 Tax=Parachitinimonas caeni TaxID=3031301 RepID=A0ABT7DUR6_9NEIS|nr:PTS sugar transporter subunit IIA [Parachitinimonas caeni]MDK2123719.1 PTS sugar transporter subunit IIA [Parachitinimonas caeni]